MNKSTVVEILRTFTTDELKEFEDFVSSPYFNKNKSINKLYGVIKKYHADFESDDIKKENLWKKVYQGKKYNYGTMKNLIFDLNKMVFKFIELKRHFSKENEIDVNFLEEFKSRNLKSLFIKKLQEAKKKASSAKFDKNYFYFKYMLEHVEKTFIDYEFQYDIKAIEDFTALNENLSLFYFYSFFYDSYNKFSVNLFSPNALNREYYNEILSWYEKSPHKNDFAEMIYLCFKLVYDFENKENYYKLKELFFENSQQMGRAIKYDIVSALLNFCRDNFRRLNNDFIKDEFIYVKHLLEEDLYKESGFGWLDQYLFMTSVITACDAGEFIWAHKFIEKYNDRLLEKIRNQYYNFAHITLNMKQKKYEEALKYLSQCESINEADKMNLRLYQFVIYYEFGYQEEIKYLTDTTNHYLKKSKIHRPFYKSAFKLFMDSVNKLVSYKCEVDEKKKNKHDLFLIKQLIDENKIANPKWILEKITELEKEIQNKND